MPVKRHMQRSAALAASVALGFASPLGCGDNTEDQQDTLLVINSATSSLQSILLLAQLAEVAFKIDRVRINRPLPEARPIATGDLVTNIGELLVLLGCDDSAQTTTDDDTFVEVQVDCESSLFGVALRGRLLAELEFESMACGAELCPAVLVWTLSSPDPTPFSYTAAAIRLEITEALTLRFPVALGEARTMRADRVDVTNTDPFAAEVNAEWTAGACITMTLDTLLTQLPGQENPALIDVFPINFSGQDIRVCLGRCPDRGQVFVSYALGTILEWMYGPSNVVEVFGPRTEAISTTLACSP